MKLFDFECGTCGSKFEQLIDGTAVLSLPCVRAPVCGGTAVRQLGGHPAHSSWPPGYFEHVAGSCPDFPDRPPQPSLGGMPVHLRPIRDEPDGATVYEASTSSPTLGPVLQSLPTGTKILLGKNGEVEATGEIVDPPPGEDA